MTADFCSAVAISMSASREPPSKIGASRLVPACQIAFAGFNILLKSAPPMVPVKLMLAFWLLSLQLGS